MSSAEPPRVADDVRHRGYLLRSAFQPIFSFSHQRLIGHEALLRATDVAGRAIPPQDLFDRCATIEERRSLDEACNALHVRGFARSVDSNQWLFLNVDASAFQPFADPAPLALPLFETVRLAGMRPNQVVIELLEAELPDGPEFERWANELKQHGFIVALDDFGAGHSNFDRVFRLRPHIVKLDRTVIARAAVDGTVRRVMAQMIALLHECGAQVLIEGVESSTEANIALDCDADFVQGFRFGRPKAVLRRPSERSREMRAVWASCDDRSRLAAADDQRRLAQYRESLMLAKRLLEVGRPIEEACAAFVELEQADLCYLLDAEGSQLDRCVSHATDAAPEIANELFAPLLDVRGARWSRRGYFRNALATPDVVHVTRPYPTMHSPLMSVTMSIGFTLGGKRVVLCGDKLWRAQQAAAGSDGASADASNSKAEVGAVA